MHKYLKLIVILMDNQILFYLDDCNIIQSCVNKVWKCCLIVELKKVSDADSYCFTFYN